MDASTLREGVQILQQRRDAASLFTRTADSALDVLPHLRAVPADARRREPAPKAPPLLRGHVWHGRNSVDGKTAVTARATCSLSS